VSQAMDRHPIGGLDAMIVGEPNAIREVRYRLAIAGAVERHIDDPEGMAALVRYWVGVRQKWRELAKDRAYNPAVGPVLDPGDT
jgi:hypothetical protein